MQKESEITLSFSSEVTPIDSESGEVFLQSLYEYTSQLYETRRTKVADNIPLLSSEENPLYTQADIDTTLAYSIDIRNIHKWINYFTSNTQTPPQTAETITFDAPPQYYDHLGDVLFLQFDTELALEFKETPPVDLNELGTTLTFKYTPDIETLTLTFEEDTEVQVDTELETIEETPFETPYDLYQAHLNGEAAEKHEAFAIFSPSTDYETVAEHIQSISDSGTMVVVTEDDWKICAKSPENTDFVVDVSLVEFLKPVSDTIVEYYETFSYSTKYIHLPELQYLYTTDEAYLSNTEKQLLRGLPYAIPFGDEEELESKLQYAQRLEPEVVPESVFDSLQYNQFIQQDS